MTTPSLSDQVVAILNQQISLVKSGKLDEAMGLADKVDQLLSRADQTQLKQISDEGEVRRLHDELYLMIGIAKTEASAELKGLHKGKNILRVYKSN